MLTLFASARCGGYALRYYATVTPLVSPRLDFVTLCARSSAPQDAVDIYRCADDAYTAMAFAYALRASGAMMRQRGACAKEAV